MRRSALLLAGWIGSAAALFAGTSNPKLVVPYTAEPIAIDGLGEAAWGASEVFFIGIDIFTVTFQALHDGRTLYVMVVNASDWEYGAGAGAAIWFDDEGGTTPQLWDDAYTAPACSGLANRGEGRLGWFLTAPPTTAHEERWEEFTSGAICPLELDQNGSSAAIFFAPPSSGLSTEVALPLDGPSALTAASGEEFGLFVESMFASLGNIYIIGYWPPTGWASPPAFGNTALAALACNFGLAGFDPHFPADWLDEGSGGSGWLRSGGAGCGTANGTGGAGESACVVRGSPPFPVNASLVSPWFSLRGQTAATLTYRAAYADAAGSADRLDLEVRTATLSWTPLLSWTQSHGVPGGELVNVDLSALASEARVQLRWRYSVQEGGAGFGAQVDEVRIRCAPQLFADAFESGLTTHWSATVP